MIYLDASVLVPLVVIEATTDSMTALCERHEGELVVSDFAIGEATAALARLVRTGLLADTALMARAQELRAFGVDMATAIATTSSDIRLATTFVEQYALGLRLPDAIHLALCRRHGYALVTSDQRLLHAASRLSIETLTL